MSKQLIALLLFLGISTNLIAQKVSYPQLVNRASSPTIFLDNMVLPGDEGKTKMSFIFRFNNDFIPFKKIPMNTQMMVPESADFYSTIRLSSEIFNGSLKDRKDNLIQSVSRDVWSDTLFTKTFEETQSSKYYTAGSLTAELVPGNYHYILQLSMMQEINERNTQRRNVKIPDLKTKKTGEIMLVRNSTPKKLELINMGDNVPFGKDFTTVIRIPAYEVSSSYKVQVSKAQVTRRDTTMNEGVFDTELSSDQIYTNSTLSMSKDFKDPTLVLSQDDFDYTYALLTLPASSFENTTYMVTLTKDDEKKPLAKQIFRSYWPDMPASLYSLDIAIANLSYIIPNSEIKRISKGSDKEKEEKFRQFWDSKDPTPKTVYNELMAEYYRRIDYAYKEFRSQQFPMGHESDMGEVYIKFGPPTDKERRFPQSGKTVEVWKYPNKTFVFQASSGFGDFVLVGTQ